MRVLFVHPYMHIRSGAGKVMLSEAELLEEKGHEVFFFATNKEPFLFERNYFKEYFPNHIDYKKLPPHKLINNFFRIFYNTEAEKKLDLMIKEIKPDIIHVHEWGIHLTPSVLNACYKNKIPVVTTIHGSGFFCPGESLLKGGEKICIDEPCIKGNYLPCLFNGCLTRGIVFGTGSLLLRYVHKNIFGLVNKINHYICPSTAIYNLALRAGIPNDKLSVVNNFADEQLMKTEPTYQVGKYFLYIGRLDKGKGVHYLIEAMKTLPKDIRLHIVGKGALEEQLKTMAKGVENVEFKGFLSGKDIENEYKGCIASILPSNCFEAFGLTIVESFTCGKPVIASNMGGIPEIVDNDINGILVEAGNVEEIKQAILKLYNNPELAVDMGRQGKNKLETKFNKEAHYDNLIEVYRKIENSIR